MKKMFSVLVSFMAIMLFTGQALSSSIPSDVDLIAKYENPQESNWTFESGEGREDLFNVVTTSWKENDLSEPIGGTWQWKGDVDDPRLNDEWWMEIKAGKDEQFVKISDLLLEHSWETFNKHSVSHIAFYHKNVPIPSAFWLLVSGIIGIVGIKRKKIEN